jgi:hypothetical protein
VKIVAPIVRPRSQLVVEAGDELDVGGLAIEHRREF